MPYGLSFDSSRCLTRGLGFERICEELMNFKKLLEENLREAACFGDLETLDKLIFKGVDVNSKNDINGWTALHWAAYRDNIEAVTILLRNGADKLSLTHEGDSPSDLTDCESIQILLGGEVSNKRHAPLPITPNYLKNPPLYPNYINKETNVVKQPDPNSEEVLLLKLRVAESSETDFIEIELPKSELSFDKLVSVCCEELGIEQSSVLKIRKLPNTIVRNNKDVMRLQNLQELEVVKS